MRARVPFLVVSGLLAVVLTGCCSGGQLQSAGWLPRSARAPTASPTILPKAEELAVPLSSGGFAEAPSQEQQLIDLYQRVSPAVVNVRVTKRSEGSFRFQPEQGSPPDEYVRGQGSGFVIDREGHIVTNNHVVEGAEEVLVAFPDSSQAWAKVVGADPDSDLAVIKIDRLPSEDILPLEIGDSDRVQVGQTAIAIGNPFGLQGTLTTGIISAVGRTLPLGRESVTLSGRFSIPRMLQTDAAINPGNSGGPLLDLQGRVVGINTAINAREGVNSGVGFAVPANLIRRIVPQLIDKGRYSYPWLGITGRDVGPDVAEAMRLPSQYGALVVGVAKGSPAERAGLRGSDRSVTVHDSTLQVGGDVLMAVDGIEIRRFDDLLVYLIEKVSVGQRISLTVWRNGKPQTVEVTLIERPQD